jgi:class 3 adenylate cyclase
MYDFVERFALEKIGQPTLLAPSDRDLKPVRAIWSAFGQRSSKPKGDAELRECGLGMITFLFIDIEASTQRWESHREAMASAVARHDAVMRAASD